MGCSEIGQEEYDRLLAGAYRKIEVWKEQKKHYRLAALELAGGDVEKMRTALDKTVDKL